MSQKHLGERRLCGAHYSGGASLRTLEPSAYPEIFAFSGLRDSAGTAPNGIRCFTEHSGPKYTQPPNPAQWWDPRHGCPRGPGPPREGEDPDQNEASSEEESGVGQELSKSEAGYREDGNLSLLSIPSAGNCQGAPGIPQGLILREMTLLATFATIIRLQPWGKMKNWKRNVTMRNLLNFQVNLHGCQRKETTIPGDSGTAFRTRRVIGRVDAEIPGPLADIGWAGNEVRQISAEAWGCGEQKNNVSLDRQTSGG
ncbi:DnaJ-like protein subfamily C member 14 [Heterocephalus glaber]|uniref:DnaJ-like protein subfamily C member 14 n=1 Tax=Heterocephalus glaber TaxID=10181 RepID=G5C1H6_HETGA|nr:DnaJ-like protein subfamily C member 14 [Heterocephalus glaber]